MNASASAASSLHTSTRRGFAVKHDWLAAFRAEPPAERAVRRVHARDLADGGALVAAREPVLVDGCTEGWPAAARWATADALCAAHGALRFELAAGVEMSLAEYAAYASGAAADFPYYLFERRFRGERGALLADYALPGLFADDLLGLVPGSSMRFFIAGGARTGTCLHVDPLLTSAWNACLCGAKRWVLLPPGTPLAAGLAPAVATPCAWFTDAYPRLVEAAERGELRLLECVQRPGEIVFVPSGWWHGVLNLEWSVAVTHNFLHAAALPALWPQLKAQYPPFAMVLAECLGHSRPRALAELRRATPPAACPRAGAPPLPVRLPLAVLKGWLAERPRADELRALGAAGVRRLSLFHERLDAVARCLAGCGGRLQLTARPGAPGGDAMLPAALRESLEAHDIALHSPPVVLTPASECGEDACVGVRMDHGPAAEADLRRARAALAAWAAELERACGEGRRALSAAPTLACERELSAAAAVGESPRGCGCSGDCDSDDDNATALRRLKLRVAGDATSRDAGCHEELGALVR